MKNIKRLIALVLVFVSVFAITIPAMAATSVDVSPITVVHERHNGMEACIYSSMYTGSQVLLNLQNESNVQITFNTGAVNWVSASKNGVSGYMPNTFLTLSTSQLRQGMFANATLQRGHEGQAVSNLQMCLTTIGYGTNGIDGIFGGDTEDAVRRFQRQNGLTEDGIAGRNTQLAMLAIFKSNYGW